MMIVKYFKARVLDNQSRKCVAEAKRGNIAREKSVSLSVSVKKKKA